MKYDKTINVLFPMTGKEMGGSHIALYLLLKNLPKHINPIVYLDQEGKFSDFLRNESLPYKILKIDHYISKEKGIVNNLKAFFKNYNYVSNIFKKEDIDLIHVSDDPLPATFLFYAKLKKKPILWHHHNILSKSRIIRLATYLCKNHIFVSDSLKNKINHIDGEIIYNPIEISSTHLTDLKMDNNQILKVGFFSNLYKRKNPFVLIKALKELKTMGYKFSCYIYGDDREISKLELQKLIKELDIEENFHFFNFSNEIEKHMRAMDVIVAPAQDEPFGRVLIEAMSYKIPVIASYDSGHKEIITNEQTGLFFNLNDPIDLCKKMIYLIENPTVKISLIEAGYQEVIQKYNIKDHVTKIDTVYKEILSQT